MTLWDEVSAATAQRMTRLGDPMWNGDKRRAFTNRFSWAIPTEEAIAAIKEHLDGRRLLEVGAGLGLWARLLSEAGVTVIATDLKQSPAHADFETQQVWFPVEQRGAVSAVRRHRECEALMLCWPPYNKLMAASALKEFHGDRLVYVGEGAGGCTGDDAFHRRLEQGWEQSGVVYIPRWEGIHDAVYLYKRGPSGS